MNCRPMKLKFFCYLFLLGVCLPIMGQEDAWVYFTDKENVSFHLNNPNTILSQQALNRKALHNIAIDERDVPVNENYITQVKAEEGIQVLAKSKWFNAVHVRGEVLFIEALENLSFVSDIVYADRSLNTLSRPSNTNDKFEIENTQTEFIYGTTDNQVTMIAANQLHLQNFTGEGMLIAVMDSGFPNVNTMSAFQRLRDNGNLLDGYDFVDSTDDIYAFTANDHGTKVLSDMAGFVQDEFVGTAPDASYYLFRTEDVFSENPVEESYWVEAAERADSLGVHVINTSLGYTTYDNPNYSYTPSDMNGTTAFISKGATIAAQKGMLVVNSAGNSGHVAWQTVGAPADAPEVFSIGAVDANGDYAFFSSIGSSAQPTQKPDVVARGLSTFVINSNNEIVNNNGTSFSSPVLAGGLACLWQALPSLTAAQLKDIVRQTASQASNPDDFLGFGIPNLAQALDLALSVSDFEAVTLSVFPNPVQDYLNINTNWQHANFEVKIYNQLGKQLLKTQFSQNSNRIEMTSWSSGIYILSIQAEGFSKQFKLIKL